MRLTLLVADLPLPDTVAGTSSLSLPFPALHTLLARGDTRYVPGSYMEETLLETFGAAAPSSFPVAAVSLHGEGIDPGPHAWLRADPVHLQVMRDHIQLSGADKLALTPGEATALIDTLNRHLETEYAAERLRIFSAAPERWYLQVEQAAAPHTVPLWRMEGQSVFESLPVSHGAFDWKRLANEIQMLLHEHPVNAAREAAGQLPVNGVWFWGEGNASTVDLHAAFSMVYANDALARGLARQAQLEVQPVPKNLSQLMQSPLASSASLLVVLDNTAHAWRAADERAWGSACTHAETSWFSPALAALKSGALTQLELRLPTASQTLRSTIVRSHLWRFWRRSLPRDHA